MGVLAASRIDAPAAAVRRSRGAEQRFEEIAVIRVTGTGAGPWAAELKACAPVGRGTELLAGTRTRSELIVRGALFRAAKHLIRFADFLEASFGVLFLADVRMVFARNVAIRLLDLRIGGIPRHAHHFVIILEFHPSPGI